MTQPAASSTVTPVLAPEKTDRLLTRIPVHPLLLAAWPVLRLYGDNVKEFSVSEIVLPLATAVGLAAVVLLALAAIWRQPLRAAIVTSALVLPFLTFSLIASAVAPIWPHEPIFRSHLMTIAVWLGVVALSLYAAAKLRGSLGRVTEALNLLSLVLVIVATIPIVSHELTARSQQSVSSGTEDVAAAATAQGSETMRDIYHIVLDRYGSDDALAIGYGVDNTEYTASLEERGFQVLENSHANFERSVHSLASTFDLSLLDDLAEQMGPDNPSWGPFYELVKENPAGSLLQDLGYRYVHVGSWYHQTAGSDTADLVVRPVHLVDLQSVLLDQSAVSGLAATIDVLRSLDRTSSA